MWRLSANGHSLLFNTRPHTQTTVSRQAEVLSFPLRRRYFVLNEKPMRSTEYMVTVPHSGLQALKSDTVANSMSEAIQPPIWGLQTMAVMA